MVETTPLVSVITPAYNAERFLAVAVRSSLEQTWPNIEVLVVDDGSTDGTAELARCLAAADDRVRVIEKAHAGVSAARNAAFAVARGEFLCFLDADDMMLPDRVERQVSFLRLFPACDLVFSDIYIGDRELTPVKFVCKRPPVLPVNELLLYRNWIGMLSPLLRASLRRKVGGFDEKLTHSEDWDYWIRCAEVGNLSYLPGPVIVKRSHEGQASEDWRKCREGFTRLIEKHRAHRSREWRAAQAARAWLDAQRHWGRREHVPMIGRLCESLWHARSRRIVKNVAAVLAPDP
jgi:glycosyltransferase involved in cell wall biosynthesis